MQPAPVLNPQSSLHGCGPSRGHRTTVAPHDRGARPGHARLARPALAIVLLCATSLGVACKPDEPVRSATVPAGPAGAPATAPAASGPAATTRAAIPGVRDWTYLDVVRAAHPAAAKTEPSPVPLTLSEAARVLLNDPVYVDEQGHLWVTRADATPTERALKAAAADNDVSEHVVFNRVLFAWWAKGPRGGWTPYLVVPRPAGVAGGDAPEEAAEFELVGPARRRPLGGRGDYRWDRARSWADGPVARLTVPTTTGVAVFTLGGDKEPVAEAYREFANGRAVPTVATAPTTRIVTLGGDARPASGPAAATVGGPSTTAEPQFAFAPGGLLAWLPPDGGGPNGEAKATAATAPADAAPSVARFVGGAWHPLAADAGWPARPVHLIPLRDGSVTELLADGAGLRLAFNVLPAAPGADAGGVNGDSGNGGVDPAAVRALLYKLADGDPKVREEVFAQLADFGPGLLPVLRGIPERDLPPQARAAVRGLLRNQALPMLGGLGVRGEHLRVAARLRDGGILLYTADGVAVPNPDGDEPLREAPAWIAARPGLSVGVLPPALTQDATPDKPQVDVVGGRWVATTDARGPRLFGANLFRTLLRPADAEFTHVVGVDRRGRWLFRRPADVAAAANAGLARPVAAPRPVSTLIVDPTLPDFTPRLPAWVFDNSAADAAAVNAPPAGNGPPAGDGAVGWDKDGWPAAREGNADLRLLETGWAPLPDGSQLLTEVPAVDVPVEPTTAPAHPPATTIATRPTTAGANPSPAGPPLYVDPRGLRYFDGVNGLTCVAPDGTRTDWPLSGPAVGQAPAKLVGTPDGLLFLFNQPGRVLRIRPTPGEAQPFVVERTFTRNIPSGEPPKRIWLDPAGRIVLALDRKLVILFPSGHVPEAIRAKMPDPIDEDE
jgi:hypothetical protein